MYMGLKRTYFRRFSFRGYSAAETGLQKVTEFEYVSRQTPNPKNGRDKPIPMPNSLGYFANSEQ